VKKNRKETLTFNKAVDLLLHRSDTRMMIMHSADGDHFYIVPGGLVDPSTAQKILKQPDIIELDDGLFPGNPQSWRLQH
jgi:hypothetical protein